MSTNGKPENDFTFVMLAFVDEVGSTLLDEKPNQSSSNSQDVNSKETQVSTSISTDAPAKKEIDVKIAGETLLPALKAAAMELTTGSPNVVSEGDSTPSDSNDIVDRRMDVFEKMIANVIKQENIKVLKNIGDELIIAQFCDPETDTLNFIEALYISWSSNPRISGHKSTEYLQTRSNSNGHPHVVNPNDSVIPRRFRVAIHAAKLADIATGTDLTVLRKHLDSLLKRLVPNTLPEILWPALPIMQDDIFGAPMNRAARLAGIPRESQFMLSTEALKTLVISQDVANLEIPQGSTIDEVHITASINRWQGIQTTTKVDCLPLAKLKNIETVSIESPWHVFQVRPVAEPAELVRQLKSVQSFRLLELQSGGIDTKRYLEERQRAQVELLEVFKSNDTSVGFYIDMAFTVENSKLGFAPARDRDHRGKPLFRDADTAPNISRNAFLIVTSTPDLDIDKQLRDNYLKFSTIDDIEIFPRTWRIYQRASYIRDSMGSKVEHSTSLFYLIEFQARAGNGLTPDDIGSVFNNIHSDGYFSGMGIVPQFYGLLEGETDGFLLVSLNVRGKVKSFEELQEAIINANSPKKQKNFLNRVAPIALYELSLFHVNPRIHEVGACWWN